MTELFNKLLFKVVSFFGAGGILLGSSIILIVASSVCVVLARVKENYDLKSRLWCVFLSLGIVAFSVALLTVIPAPPVYAVCVIGVALICFSPVFCVSVKPCTDGEEQKELARFIDKELMRAKMTNEKDNSCEPNFVNNQTFIDNAREENATQCQMKNYGVDFEHVKNVIRRMDYFGLNTNDKRQVRELEVALSEAERGDFTESVKNRINDGLSALLKIMSKYGV